MNLIASGVRPSRGTANMVYPAKLFALSLGFLTAVAVFAAPAAAQAPTLAGKTVTWLSVRGPVAPTTCGAASLHSI